MPKINRFGAWHGGADPLESPYDIRQALDEIGDDVLHGADPRTALNRLLRQGTDGRDGLDALRRKAREQARRLRRGQPPRRRPRTGPPAAGRGGRGRAVRAVPRPGRLGPDGRGRTRQRCPATPRAPSSNCRTTNGARRRRGRSTSRSRRCCASEVLDAQFNGMRDALQNADPEEMERIREMMHALNEMLDADARGEHTDEDFAEFMQQYGDFFPENPQNLAELVDALARQAAADAAADELADSRAAGRAGRPDGAGAGRRRPGRARWPGCRPGLRSARPDLRWGGASGWTATSRWVSPTPPARWPNWPTSTARRDARQDYPGRRWTTSTRSWSSGRSAGRRSTTSSSCAGSSANCSEQGYLERGADGLQLDPAGAAPARRDRAARVFAQLDRAGAAGTTCATPVPPARSPAPAANGSSATSSPGRRADGPQRRAASAATAGAAAGAAAAADDFEVVETERRIVGGHRAAGRHVLLDGAARHLGRGQDDRDGAALARHDEVPAGPHPDHRVQRLRARARAARAGRARLGPGAGHQPAARPDAGPPPPARSSATPSR